MASQPNADAVLSPIYDAKRRSVPPWFGETCPDARARGIRIKSDAERAEAGSTVNIDVYVKVKGAGGPAE
jgi:hypothetical protein